MGLPQRSALSVVLQRSWLSYYVHGWFSDTVASERRVLKHRAGHVSEMRV